MYGKNLQRLQKEKRLRRTTLASKSKVSYQTIYRHEKMECPPDGADSVIANKLADALGVPIEELIGGASTSAAFVSYPLIDTGGLSMIESAVVPGFVPKPDHRYEALHVTDASLGRSINSVLLLDRDMEPFTGASAVFRIEGRLTIGSWVPGCEEHGMALVGLVAGAWIPEPGYPQ